MNKKNNGMIKNTLYYVLVLLAMVMVVYFIFGNANNRVLNIYGAAERRKGQTVYRSAC